MAQKQKHPSAAARSRGGGGPGGKPPPAGAGPRDQVVGPREVIKQAARDIEAGLLDSDRRRTPDDVPGPHEDPAHTRGARVPPGGVDRHK